MSSNPKSHFLSDPSNVWATGPPKVSAIGVRPSTSRPSEPTSTTKRAYNPGLVGPVSAATLSSAYAANPAHRRNDGSALTQQSRKSNMALQRHISTAAPISRNCVFRHPARIPISAFRVGLIVRSDYYEPALDTATGGSTLMMPTKSIYTISTGNGTYQDKKVCYKMRPFIIVAVHSNSVTCVPMYSHNGQGLGRKEPRIRHEYVSVRDHRRETHLASLKQPVTEYQRQGPHAPVITNWMAEGENVLCDESTAWLTFLVSLRMAYPMVVCGKLDEKSVGRLCGLVSGLGVKIPVAQGKADDDDAETPKASKPPLVSVGENGTASLTGGLAGLEMH